MGETGFLFFPSPLTFAAIFYMFRIMEPGLGTPGRKERSIEKAKGSYLFAQTLGGIEKRRI